MLLSLSLAFLQTNWDDSSTWSLTHLVALTILTIRHTCTLSLQTNNLSVSHNRWYPPDSGLPLLVTGLLCFLISRIHRSVMRPPGHYVPLLPFRPFPNLWTRYFENEWTHFHANYQNGRGKSWRQSVLEWGGQGHTRPSLQWRRHHSRPIWVE